MRKIIEVTLAALATLMTIVPVVAPATGTATASLTVPISCDVSATGPINFGSWLPGTTSSTMSTTISEPTGNQVVTPDISGTTWTGTGGTPPTFAVGQTKWAVDPTPPTTSLTGSPVGIGATIGPGSSKIINLNVAVPAGQTADAYTQTITLGVTC